MHKEYGSESGEATAGKERDIFHLVGASIALMSQSKFHRTWSVADIERLIVPPIQLGQCRLYRVDNRPIGLVTWAFFDVTAERAFHDGTRKIQAPDWHSGNRLWIIDFIAPFGGARNIVRDLRKNIFFNRTAKSTRRDHFGNILKINNWNGCGVSNLNKNQIK
ncbi:toxin-activating lysine-acyltransferase [Azospirillum argentinense]|uniref:RTX toxin-activating lysine-acyltransferase n=1 Tax=Azospirillum brasilense TaxID=192 RepID=A0A4D8QEI9_AZOBR|nr:toxin-activating lysine-acyltransferase [Azospirillum argentinense]QCO07283.1 toxin-activating lysine-acyltransferase [Azospirillum argentinense]